MPTATEIRQQVLTCVREVVPDALTPEAAASLVQEFAVIERAAATGRMFCALRVARSDAWRGKGHATAADWLAAETGITVREAAAQLGTAKKAAGLPKTEAAMRSGKLSPTQAGAVTDGAAADPTAEDGLLASAAEDTTAALKEKAAKARAAATDSATREARIRAQRSVRTRTDADGAFHLHLQGPAADGIRLTAMLRPYVEQAFRSSRRNPFDGPRDTFDNRTYDAFLAMIGVRPSGAGPVADTSAGAGAAEQASTGPVPGAPPGNAADRHAEPAGRGCSSSAAGCTSDLDAPASEAPQGGSGAPNSPPAPGGAAAPEPPGHPAPLARPPGGDNVKVIVRIDHSALVRGHTVAGETCDIPGLGPIPVAAARELLGEAFLAFVITKGRDVATVAHVGRGLNAHQRTAVEWLGMRCSNAACNRTVALQVDHRTPWIEHQETKLDNQDPLCPDCHRRKTHHGWHLEPGRGPRRFLPPADPPSRPGQPAAPEGGSRIPRRPQGERDNSVDAGRNAPTRPAPAPTPRRGAPRRRPQANPAGARNRTARNESVRLFGGEP